MAMREILLYPQHQAALRRKCDPTPAVSRRVGHLIQNLKDTLAAYPEGVGLAAPQIGVYLRVVVVCLGATNNQAGLADRALALVNPVVRCAAHERLDFDGCLSFPGLFGETVRPHTLLVTGQGEDGRPFERLFEGFDAVVVHHELDHLDGVLFIDRLKSLADLYTLSLDEDGRPVRRPVQAGWPAGPGIPWPNRPVARRPAG